MRSNQLLLSVLALAALASIVSACSQRARPFAARSSPLNSTSMLGSTNSACPENSIARNVIGDPSHTPASPSHESGRSHAPFEPLSSTSKRPGA